MAMVMVKCQADRQSGEKLCRVRHNSPKARRTLLEKAARGERKYSQNWFRIFNFIFATKKIDALSTTLSYPTTIKGILHRSPSLIDGIRQATNETL